ncbi:hypothetical protein Tsubulata_027791 [Turnera subulata]|uniref:RRM domain-containing protein n=1 Tax=Turnera subulata TaxID=218843 RepID=A0A9Q0F1A1_9ROSI|nr:hypothetical protein Tsubulata_027791 [Turnera subulata]
MHPQTPARKSIPCSPISPGMPSQRPPSSMPLTTPFPTVIPSTQPSLPNAPPLPPPLPSVLPPLVNFPYPQPHSWGHPQAASTTLAPVIHPTSVPQNYYHQPTAPVTLPIIQPSHQSYSAPINQHNHQVPSSQPHQPKPLHFSKWSRKVIHSAIENNLAVSIYVANIPLRWLPTDVHLLMSRFGEVLDVFIPQKRNKQGKRFAFVRFRNNIDTQHLLRRITSVEVDGTALVANIARGRKGIILNKNISHDKATVEAHQAFTKAGRSFVDTGVDWVIFKLEEPSHLSLGYTIR